jgi:hypothetical protein
MRGTGRVAPAIVAAVVLLSLVAACGSGNGATVTYPVGSVGPDRTVSPAVAQTRGQVAQALGARNLILNDAQTPYRPPESAMLATAPRAVYQVTLPADPTGGYIVVYEFADTALAAQAAAEQQAYLATGPGRIQSPQGTVHVIRQVGTTVVYYAWQPGADNDPGAAEIQAALETLGVGYPVPA